MNIFHALFNVLALVPLLERFEAEHGTLLTGAIFIGRELVGAVKGDLG
jgi:membrane associated rhomboid family serine protease